MTEELRRNVQQKTDFANQALRKLDGASDLKNILDGLGVPPMIDLDRLFPAGRIPDYPYLAQVAYGSNARMADAIQSYQDTLTRTAPIPAPAGDTESSDQSFPPIGAERAVVDPQLELIAKLLSEMGTQITLQSSLAQGTNEKLSELIGSMTTLTTAMKDGQARQDTANRRIGKLTWVLVWLTIVLVLTTVLLVGADLGYLDGFRANRTAKTVGSYHSTYHLAGGNRWSTLDSPDASGA